MANSTNRLRRDRQHGSEPENNEDNSPDDEPDLLAMQDDTDEDFNMEEDIDEDDRSSSPVFVPHSRQTSPETIMHPNGPGNLSEIDVDDFSEVDIKLEPKVEPEEETMAQPRYYFARPGQTHNVIDLTEESDESTSGGSSTMEVIDLTEDPEPIRNSNIDGAVVDLTEDSDVSRSPMDIIELDD